MAFCNIYTLFVCGEIHRANVGQSSIASLGASYSFSEEYLNLTAMLFMLRCFCRVCVVEPEYTKIDETSSATFERNIYNSCPKKKTSRPQTKTYTKRVNDAMQSNATMVWLYEASYGQDSSLRVNERGTCNGQKQRAVTRAENEEALRTSLAAAAASMSSRAYHRAHHEQRTSPRYATPPHSLSIRYYTYTPHLYICSGMIVDGATTS